MRQRGRRPAAFVTAVAAILVITAACDAPTAPESGRASSAPAAPGASPGDTSPPSDPGGAAEPAPPMPAPAPIEPAPPPAPPPPSPPPPPPPDTTAILEDAVLELVNQRRAAGASCADTAFAPAPPLYMHPGLRAAARGHSKDMAAANYFSHTSLDGRTFDQRIRDAGYAGAFPLGENLAGGPSTAEAVVEGLMGSPGHCANIMSPGFRALGVGYAHNPAATYRHYWTQTFGGS